MADERYSNLSENKMYIKAPICSWMIQKSFGRRKRNETSICREQHKKSLVDEKQRPVVYINQYSMM